MPATISRTTEGRRTRGNSPSRNGAANATTDTMSRLVSEGISLPPWGGCRGAPAFVTPARGAIDSRQHVAGDEAVHGGRGHLAAHGLERVRHDRDRDDREHG